MEEKDKQLQDILQQGATPVKPSLDVPDTNEQENSSDWLNLLKKEFLTYPVLSVLEYYLQNASTTKSEKRSSLKTFKANHSKLYAIVFILDLLFKFLYLLILLVVVLRGLGLTDFIKNICQI